jgi:hypothetical protein
MKVCRTGMRAVSAINRPTAILSGKYHRELIVGSDVAADAQQMSIKSIAAEWLGVKLPPTPAQTC